MNWKEIGKTLFDMEKNKKMNKNLDKIKKYRGQIITWALEIEDLLERILSNYFMRDTNNLEDMAYFEVEIMRELGFDKKIQIFNKIAKREKYPNKKLSLIMKAIQNIQNMRNKVAHWRPLAYFDTGKVFLRYKDEMEQKEMLSLDNQLLKNLKSDKETAYQEIVKFYQWFHSLKRKQVL